MGRKVNRLIFWIGCNLSNLSKISKPHNNAGLCVSKNFSVLDRLSIYPKFCNLSKPHNQAVLRAVVIYPKFILRARAFFLWIKYTLRVYILSNRKKVIYSNTINYFVLYAKIYVCEKLRRFAPTPCKGACCNFSANIFLRVWEMIAICFIAPKTPFYYARGINYTRCALKSTVEAIARVCGALKLENKTAARNLFFQFRQSWGRRGAAFSCATKNF